jgi:hypothetical protein
MFTSKQYRDKAADYNERAAAASAPEDERALRDRGRSFDTLAENEQWLAENHERTVHAPVEGSPARDVAAQEEHILRCLGAAVIMQWNTIPTKLQRELFDTAGAMGDVLETPELRGQIARFLHKHKNGDVAP